MSSRPLPGKHLAGGLTGLPAKVNYIRVSDDLKVLQLEYDGELAHWPFLQSLVAKFVAATFGLILAFCLFMIAAGLADHQNPRDFLVPLPKTLLCLVTSLAVVVVS